MLKPMPLSEAKSLPFWRRPVTLLFVMAVAMPLSFSTWSVLLNNFVHEVGGFDGYDLGWLHTVREIPGFFAISVILLLLLFREQVLALISLILLGAATALTAAFPEFGGILMITFLSSIGFHFYETVNQSLQLQWLEKAKAPQVLGRIIAVGSAATLVAYLLIKLAWKPLGLTFEIVYPIAGGATVLIALLAFFAYPQFESPNPQRKEFVLRRRYWLYYALQFMSGARRQIFVVFAGWMMVERFGYEVDDMVSLVAITLIANMVAAPLIGKAVHYWGEKTALVVEYTGLALIFLCYGGIYWFGWGIALAAALYVLDHIFFALALALKTYFQKIADPADIAPTAAVAFTINHTAAVFLPALLGLLWVVSPGAVFGLAAAMAIISLLLSLLIPRHPEPGNETILSKYAPAPAE